MQGRAPVVYHPASHVLPLAHEDYRRSRQGLQVPRKRPVSDGLHTYTHSGGVGFVFIDTDEGV